MVVICRQELVLVWGKETVCVFNPVKLSSGTCSPFRLQVPGRGWFIPFCDCSTAGCLWPQSSPKKPITAPFWIFPNISPTLPPRLAYSLCPTVQQGTIWPGVWPRRGTRRQHPILPSGGSQHPPFPPPPAHSYSTPLPAPGFGLS